MKKITTEVTVEKRSACGYGEPRRWKAAARHRRQFALGAGSHARQPRVGAGVGPQRQ